MKNNSIVLELNNIEKGFFGVKVLHGINLKVEEGEVLGLVGENGAGKSTMMNVIGGVLKRDSGVMNLFGEDYDPTSAKSAIKAGIAFVHQELNLFSNLTVAENMFIEDFPSNNLKSINYKYINKETEKYLKLYDLPVKSTDKIENISTGMAQMVEIIKSLMRDAKIMIFDEPTTSLSHSEKEKLFSTIKDLKKKNISIIYISHILEDVFSMCDSISVLRDGSIIYSEKTGNTKQEIIIKEMVGREINQLYPISERDIGTNINLSATNIYSSDGKVNGINIKLHEREIVGMYGLIGSGRTEFIRTVYGLDSLKSGKIEIKGEEISNPKPRKSIKKGVAFVSENRHKEGLMLNMPIYDNLVLVKLKDILKRFGVVDIRKESNSVSNSLEKLNIKVRNVKEQNVSTLSGGNQQKVVFAKWMAIEPYIFILDEPTRGVDVGAKFEIYSIITDMAKNGASVLIVSSEMEELMGICDRILVIRNGKIKGNLCKKEFSQERIIELAL